MKTGYLTLIFALACAACTPRFYPPKVDVPDGLELERAVLNVEMLGEAFSQRIEHLSAAAGGERFLADDDVN